MPTYHQSSEPVRIGDHVLFKEWLFFWKGWQPGRVMYVPGLSRKQTSLEFNGLTWVAVQGRKGTQVGVLIDPDTGQLMKSVRFVQRTDDDLTQTPDDFEFGDD